MKRERTSLWRKIRNAIFLILVLFPCGEIAARIIGWTPLYNNDYKVHAVPQNWLVGDSIYGLQLNPGKFSVTLNDSIKFDTSHDRFRKRRSGEKDSCERVFVYGCSFTYGYGVNDDETFVSLLNQSRKGESFSNFGVPGYGTLQGLMRLKGAIEAGNVPASVMIVHSGVHPERNGMANSYRKALKIGYKNSNKHVESNMRDARFPFLERAESTIQFVSWKEIYNNWPGREKFAIVNAIQSLSQEKPNEEELAQITEQVFEDIFDLCQANAIQCIIVNLDDPTFKKRYRKSLDNYQVEVVSINFDFTSEKCTNRPYDSHPNALGHQKIAQSILDHLNQSSE